MLDQPFIEEVIVYGTIDKKNDDIVVKAEVFPAYDNIREKLGDIDEKAVLDLIKEEIEEINDKMPAYKRVKRFKLRYEEFEKTATQKIRRTGGAIREEDE